MGNHTLELIPTKGAVVLGQLDGPAVLSASLGIALDF